MTASSLVPEPVRPGSFQGWALLPVIGTGVGDDEYRPDLRGTPQDGDRTEHVIQAGAGRCLVAGDVQDVARLSAGVVLGEHAELGIMLDSLTAARRNRVKNALAQFGETDQPGDDLHAFLRRAGRRVAGFGQTFDPALHLAASAPPPTGSFVVDNFTGTNGDLLSAHTADTGGSWTRHSLSGVGDGVVFSNRLRGSTANDAYYYPTADPATAEYDMELAVRVVTDITTGFMIGRLSTSALDGYRVRAVTGTIQTHKLVANVATSLGTYTPGWAAGTDHTLLLAIRDATKKVFVDGVERISSTDNAVTAAGKAALYPRGGSDTTGIHLDSFTATNAGGGPQNVSITNAAETDTAQALSVSKPIFKSLAVASVTNAAQALTVTKPILKSLTAATETDAAQALSVSGGPTFVSIIPAGETDASQGLSFVKPIFKALGPATETSTARALSVTHIHYRTAAPAVEQDAAIGLSYTYGESEDPYPVVLTYTETTGAFAYREPGVLSYTEPDRNLT